MKIVVEPMPAVSQGGPMPVTSIQALDALTMTVPANQLVVGATGTVTFPVPAFLIEHDSALILFDTGFAPFICDDPLAYFGSRAKDLGVSTHPAQRIDRQLAELGYEPGDVTHVVLSHAHADHAGGVSLFRKARLYAGPGELDWARSPSPDSARYFRAEDLADVPRSRWQQLTIPEHDLLGDGSVTVLHTPGHTPGQLSLVVRLATRSIVLTGDTVHLREGLERLAPYPYDWDPGVAVESVRLLAEMERAGHELWIGHDPGDWARFGPRQPLS
jgi:glyoxylase-like metal-dependent hydrolase (beta-lactamase superfamily II)